MKFGTNECYLIVSDIFGMSDLGKQFYYFKLIIK